MCVGFDAEDDSCNRSCKSF